jgi:hypothetical protein
LTHVIQEQSPDKTLDGQSSPRICTFLQPVAMYSKPIGMEEVGWYRSLLAGRAILLLFWRQMQQAREPVFLFSITPRKIQSLHELVTLLLHALSAHLIAVCFSNWW